MLSSQSFEFDAEMFYRKSKTKCRVRNSIIEPPISLLFNRDANRVSHPVNQSNFSVKKTSENVLFASVDSAFLVFVQICFKDLKKMCLFKKISPFLNVQ